MSSPLAELEGSELVDELLSMASEAAEALAESDRLRIGELLGRIRSAGDHARRENLAVLQVAQGFLEAAAGSNLGRRELMLQEFADRFPEVHRRILSAALEGELTAAELPADEALRLAVRELCDAGALREAGEAIDVPPSMRAVVRAMLEPLSLRLWRAVRGARARAAHQSPADPAMQSVILSAELGLPERDAQSHLSEFPLVAMRRTKSPFAPELSPRRSPHSLPDEWAVGWPLTVVVPKSGRAGQPTFPAQDQGSGLPDDFNAQSLQKVLDRSLS